MSEGQATPTAAAVVAAFNVFGYHATFAAVAAAFKVQPHVLYAEYPSQEALGEIWLGQGLPKSDATVGIGAVFSECTFQIIGMMQSQRDFARAWQAALRAAGVRLQKLERLHGALQDHYASWLMSRGDSISLPVPLHDENVLVVVADALALITLGLIAEWDGDRSPACGDTSKRVESMGYLIDALLTARQDFGNRGLLVHLVDLLGLPYDQLLMPFFSLLNHPEYATLLMRALAVPSRKPVMSLRELMPDPDAALRFVNVVKHALQTTGGGRG